MPITLTDRLVWPFRPPLYSPISPLRCVALAVGEPEVVPSLTGAVAAGEGEENMHERRSPTLRSIYRGLRPYESSLHNARLSNAMVHASVGWGSVCLGVGFWKFRYIHLPAMKVK